MTTEDIKRAIEQSGYLFEQRVSRIVDATGLCGHFSTTNASYTDEETGKSREVDVLAGYSQTFASHLEFKPGSNIFDQLQVFFLFECKNNFNPVVFFSRDKTLSGNFPLLHGTPDQVTKGTNSIPFIWYIESKGVRFSKTKQWISTQYAQLKETKDTLRKKGINWELSHEDYHESITGLIKACNFYADEYYKSINEKHFNENRIQLCLIYPILVFGGKLLECKVSDKDYDLQNIDYTLYKRQYFSNKIQSEFNFHVTSLTNLPDLLKNLDTEIKAIEKVIQDYIVETRQK